MWKQLSFLKDGPSQILCAIFIANMFYDDPTLYLYKRLLYSVFIYFAIWQICKNYFQNRLGSNSFKMPFFFNIYIPLLISFIAIALCKDLVNPNLKWITLLNNPFCTLSVFPILMFVVGANTDDIESIFDVLIFSICAFFIVVILPFFGAIKYYQGYVAANAFIPFFFISRSLKKYRIPGCIILLIGLYFSNLSDYRIIALRILVFIALYTSLSIFKKVGIMKLLIILITCFCLYEFIANLEELLTLFKNIIGVKSFNDDDTRAFLWKEVFEELHGSDFIFGRGFQGTYFSEYFLMILVYYNTFADHYDRFAVEVGFLQLLLKGGFLWYFLYIGPLLYTSIKGIFWHYQNNLVFSISIFLFTELLLMFIENIPYFSFQASLFFFFAGFAIRKMNTGNLTSKDTFATT
jgi:hypothetical protein